MVKESRVKKSLLNARINLICYFLSLVVAFFTRKVFLDRLGTEFIGLTGTLQSLLGFLNLAELGVASAIGYVLYKPIFDDNKEKINEIISVCGYIYRWIGFVILGAGIILSAFLPWIFPDTTFSLGVVYVGFYSFLGASMLGYFVNYKMILLAADQRNYVVTGYFQAVTTAKVIVQMVLAIKFQNFYLYLVLELLSGIVNSIILQRKINTTYPWLKSEIRLGRQLFRKYPEIGKYVRQIFVHRIATFVQFQLSPFLIYAYVSLPVVALYGNYTIVSQRIQSLVSSFLDSTASGVGNLISEGNKEKIFKVYGELFSFRLMLSGFFALCTYMLIDPFIEVWLGGEYVLPHIVVVLVCVQLFMSMLRGVTDHFINGYGLFYDTWAPVTESVLFVACSMLFGSIYGLEGTLVGPLVSVFVIIYLWKPYFLFSKGFKLPFYRYWLMLLLNLAALAISFAGAYWLTGKLSGIYDGLGGWIGWIVKSLFFALVMGILELGVFYLLVPGFRSFASRFLRRRK